jgi:putative protease
MDRVPELLAPAGDFPSLQAAINAGADAVYFGLSQLNMRARARRSFDDADLDEICRRCRESDVKAYLALNTILYDHDLGRMRSLLERAKASGVDAVIVADMAAMLAARELGIEVHVSTQLSISNYESFRHYAQWADRIVLARELSLPLIKKIHTKIVEEDLRGPSGRPMEIEAFAHGALCVAVSGRCGMSLHTSNASANRGACEQNCRKRYEVTDLDSGKKLVLDNEFVMSPEDLATIDFVDKLIDAGVFVFKLEGRARAAEYVSTVTRGYRRAIDAVASGDYGPELVEDILGSLEGVYNRGLSSGYYLGRKQGWSAKHGSKATHVKRMIGKVGNYYGKVGVALVHGAGYQVAEGDRFVVIGNKTGVVEAQVTGLRVEEKPVDRVEGRCDFTLAVPERVRVNDVFYVMQPVDAGHQT